jgi:hypothetical protein
LLNILHIPFACTSSPSSMPMILMFDLLMESVSSCISLSQESCVNLFWGENGFHPFFVFPYFHYVPFLSLDYVLFSISLVTIVILLY